MNALHSSFFLRQQLNAPLPNRAHRRTHTWGCMPYIVSFYGGRARFASVFAKCRCTFRRTSAAQMDGQPPSIDLIFTRQHFNAIGWPPMEGRGSQLSHSELRVHALRSAIFIITIMIYV